MKLFIAFLLCFLSTSYPISAIYSVEKQQISTKKTDNINPKQLSYKERVAVKYLKFKAKATKNKAVRGFLTAAVLFLIIGIALSSSSRRSNQSGNLVETADGCLTGFFAIASFIASLVMFIAAAVAAI
jgi:hypothetical protein